MPSPLLQIRDATKIYYSGGFIGDKKSVVALENFNMTIDESPATITTIAGESGSGKTTLANLVLGFIKLTSGKIIFEGEDITDMTDEQLKAYRRNVQAVFQDPFGVYNPFYRIDHIFDLVNKHFSLSDNQNEYREMVEAGLNVVGLYGEDVLRKYPHQLSGGQRQRIMMARAYMIKPRLIVADEPVSMVDASLRASILDAMLRLRDDHNISFLYITHDLSTAYQIGDQIYMLYQGTTAERGTAMDVIDAPQHPYVQLLIDSVPVPDPTDKWDVNISLPSEEEMRTAAAKGCRYYPRCPHRMDKCLVVQPPLYKMEKPKHEAACYLYEENEVAPIEPPMLVNRPMTEAAVATAAGRTRERMVAAVLVVIAFVAGVLIASNREPEVVVETVIEEVQVLVTATAIPPSEPPTATAPPAAAPESQVIVPAFVVEPAGAVDMGSIPWGEDTFGEIENADDRHIYTFAGFEGTTVELKLITGGRGLSGTGFYAPLATVYNPDGEIVFAFDRARRSNRGELTFAADGDYQIAIGADDRGRGVDAYTITIEGEAPEPTPEPTPMPTLPPPAFVVEREGAVAKGEIVFGEDAGDEIQSVDDRHSWSVAGVAGTTAHIRLITGGRGLSGTGFFAPFATMYAPDGSIVLAFDRARRSNSGTLTFAETGTYVFVLGADDRGRGVDAYTITIENEEG